MPVEKDFEELEPFEIYGTSVKMSVAREKFTTEPTLRLKCDSIFIVQNPVDDLEIAFNYEMINSPIPLDTHKTDDIVGIGGKIRGIWLKHSLTSAKPLKIIYGNGIHVKHEHRRVNIDLEHHPVWIRGAEQTAPIANTVLVTHAVAAKKEGLIYGFEITASEANQFLIKWNDGAARQNRIVFASAGTMLVIFTTPYNQGEPAAEATNITIQNVNAGVVGTTYSARLLIGEAGDN